MNQALEQAIEHWDYIAPLANRPNNDRECRRLAACLDELLETVGNDENHPLMGLVDAMVTRYKDNPGPGNYTLPSTLVKNGGAISKSSAKGFIDQVCTKQQAVSCTQRYYLSCAPFPSPADGVRSCFCA